MAALATTSWSAARTVRPLRGTFIDNFNGTASYTDNNGTANFNGGWVETGGETPTSPTAGDISIERQSRCASRARRHRRRRNHPARGEPPGIHLRVVSFDCEGDDLDAGENVRSRPANGATWEVLGNTLGGDQQRQSRSHMALTAAQIGAHTQIRFVANGSFDNGENFFVDNFTITRLADRDAERRQRQRHLFVHARRRQRRHQRAGRTGRGGSHLDPRTASIRFPAAAAC